jgi:hypothetical protein
VMEPLEPMWQEGLMALCSPRMRAGSTATASSAAR